MAFRNGALLLFPIAIMILFVMISQSASASDLSGQGSATFCQAGQNCIVDSGAQTVTYGPCEMGPGLNLWCQILPTCIPDAAPAWCFPWPLNQIPGDSGTNLWVGDSVTISVAQAAAGASGYAFFGFNTNGTLAFLGFITVLIGVATLAGLTILGSGLQGESIQILTQGALIIGIWMILSGLEGVGIAAGTDVFGQLNVLWGFGNAFYAILTLMVLIGFSGTISRSGV